MATSTFAEIEIPEGGIADFVMSKANLDLLAKEEANKLFGQKGVAEFQDVAKRMAEYGRYGDDMVVHVESGEIVVPKVLVEKNPKLKESIFENLREQGVENPEQYVVGHSKNSVNPNTGLVEFNIFKGIEKAFNKVVKVVKNILPVVLPIALSFTPLGPVYGAALGTGIAGLATGQSIGEAATAALGAGLTGLASRGVGALFKGSSPMTAMGQALRDPFGRVGETLANFGKGTFTGGFSGDTVLSGETKKVVKPDGSEIKIKEEPSLLQKAKSTFFPSSPTQDQISKRTDEIMKLYRNEISRTKALELATKELTPGFIDYLPLAGATLGVTALAGGFDKPEEKDPFADVETGSDLIEQNRFRYVTPNLRSYGSFGPYEVATPSYAQQFAKKGGEIFPRRTGGIDPSEGIPNKDSVRAMLLPGEFVMTKGAVKGLGNGNVREGIKKMYSVMRDLESRSKRMA
jgi:hypothetical protein